MKSRHLVLLIVIILVVQSAVFAVRRLQGPSDGSAYILLGPDPLQPDGIPAKPVVEYRGGLRASDVIMDVDGVSLDMWMSHALVVGLPRPRWTIGETASYTVRRGSEVIRIDQPLGRFPLADYLRNNLASDVIELIFVVLALFLFIKKPDETAAQVLLVVAAAQITTNWDWGIQATDIVDGFAFIHYLLSITVVFTLIWICYLHFALVFPRPAPVLRDHPRRVLLIYAFPYLFIGCWWLWTWQTRTSALGWLNQTMNPVIAVLGLYALLTLGAVIYTFFAVRDPIGRAQIRWVLFGVIIAFLVTAIVGIIPLFMSGSMIGPSQRLTLINLAFLLVPVTIVVAVLRYHLFDIDIIVRRTTSYAILTALLALIYFGSVILLQRLFGRVTGEQSTVAVVLSTLLIAALFLPLRRRVQDAIDRRFFRKKYDAEKVLNAFAATVRDETDLDALAAELQRVIQETMQPESVSVWLRQTTDGRPRTTGR